MEEEVIDVNEGEIKLDHVGRAPPDQFSGGKGPTLFELQQFLRSIGPGLKLDNPGL